MPLLASLRLRPLVLSLLWLGLWVQCVPAAEPEQFSFAILSDVQYADKPTAGNRHYRESRGLLEACVKDLEPRRWAFVIQLGDLIDGNSSEECTRADLARMLQTLQPLGNRLHHVLGNHCLTSGREYLLQQYGLKQAYYDFVPEGVVGWRMVVLDGNDAGYGVLSPIQLDWIRQTLSQAEARGERVLLFCHYALAAEAAAHHRLNQPKPLREILTQTHCVAAYFAGHDHAGGYAECAGIYHITLPGIVEAPPENAYALVHVFADRLELEGVGNVARRTLLLPSRP